MTVPPAPPHSRTGRGLTSAAPVQPAAHSPLLVAAGWLQFWRALGGGVTIAADGTLHLWRWIAPNDGHAPAATQMSAMFKVTPGLAPAVRRCLDAEAKQRIGK